MHSPATHRPQEAAAPQQPELVVLDENLVRQHQVAIWRFLRFLGCPADVADDLTQETFLRLLDGQLEDRGAGALRTWLKRTAFNLVRSHGRQQRKQLQHRCFEEIDTFFARTCEAQDDGALYLRALEACLATIPERDRWALQQRHGNDLSRQAIASHLQLSLDGVKTLLRRTRQRMLACIDRRLQPTERRSR